MCADIAARSLGTRVPPVVLTRANIWGAGINCWTAPGQQGIKHIHLDRDQSQVVQAQVVRSGAGIILDLRNERIIHVEGVRLKALFVNQANQFIWLDGICLPLKKVVAKEDGARLGTVVPPFALRHDQAVPFTCKSIIYYARLLLVFDHN